MKNKNYWKANWFIKRINSFTTYLCSAILSLFDPEMMNSVLYQVLKEQFEEE